MGLERERERLFGIVLLKRLSLGGKKNGTTPVGRRPIHVSMPLGERKRSKRPVPVASVTLQVEERLHRPRQFRIEPQRSLGELTLRLALAPGPRSDRSALEHSELERHGPSILPRGSPP